MNTAFLLMAQYTGRAVIPVAEVCRDCFSQLCLDKSWRSVDRRDLPDDRA
jgi:hypothetical protein